MQDYSHYREDFIGDYQKRYGDHDFSYYERAYNLGYIGAMDQGYQTWEDFEGRARVAWEEQDQEPAPWDDVKDAVKYSWERVVSDR